MTRHNVIPAPYPVVGSNRQVRGKLHRESRLRPCVGRDPETYKTGFLVSGETLLPALAYRQAGVGRGFLVKPGMTKQGECLYNYGVMSNITRGKLLRGISQCGKRN